MAVRCLLLVLLVGCGTQESPALAPREVFHWTELPISFTPPSAEWQRDGELSGGVKGVRFIKEGQSITVGEFHHIGERDRTPAIQTLLERFEELDQRRFVRESQLAQSRTDEEVNAPLRRSRTLYVHGDRAGARREVEIALAAARRFHLTLDEVLGEVAAPRPRRALVVGGEPAVSFGNEVYVMHRSHLYVARFVGTDRSLFDHVVASIEFPP